MVANAFQPTAAEIVLQAFRRIAIHRTQITIEHLTDARNELNLLQVEWANSGPNLWEVDNQTITLVPGQAVYDIDPGTIDILDAYVTDTVSTQPYDADNQATTDANVWNMPNAPTVDRIMTGLGRSEYMSLPQKQDQGSPTSFWYQKGIAQKISIWPVPMSAALFTYWRMRQIAGASLQNAATPELPYLWLDAAVAGLAHRLSRIYAPPLEPRRQADADAAWLKAAKTDTENVPLLITPDVGGYWA